MNKLLLALLVFGSGVLIVYVLAGRTADLPASAQPEGDIAYEDAKQALKDEGTGKVIGSCNAITEGSSCVDYIGSMWGDAQGAEHNCEGVGTYSHNACPYSEFGGCRTSPGTVMEMVVWAYREGPGEYTEESIPYAVAACNAAPNAQWVKPEDLL